MRHTNQILDDIETLIDYNWSEEKDDFEDHPGDGDYHIFARLKRLRDWLESEKRFQTNVPRRVAAAVLNDKGDILPYTTQSTVSQCEESARERWGEEAWGRLQELGARVIQVEITHVPTALNP